MSSRSSRTEASSDLPETVEVGRVRRPHGVRGEVLVEVASDVPGRFDAGSRLLLLGTDGRRREVSIVSSRPHRDGAVIRLAGVEDRDGAGELRGATLEVERARVPAAPPGHYYYFELVGCRCRDRTAGEIGPVVDLLEDGGGLLLQLRRGGQTLLVPFVEEFLVRVDLSDRLIEVDLPVGLLESCASGS